MNMPFPDPQPRDGAPEKSPARQPRVAVGVVVFKNGKVLLVKRKNAPGKWKWALPGGKVEFGESLQAAAERETLEETGVRVKAGSPVFTFDLIQRTPDGAVEYHFLIVDLDARYLSGEPVAGDDALEARWIAAEEFPRLLVSQRTLALLAEKFNFK